MSVLLNLTQWQIEQKKKLLQFQQMEREILSRKQNCTLKALDLSVHCNNENTEDINIEDMYITNERTLDETSMLQCSARSPDVLKVIEEEGADTDTLNEDYKKKETENSNYTSVIVNTNIDSMKDCTSNILTRKKMSSLNDVLRGVKPLSMDHTDGHVSIDDMPLPSSKKDFQTLLEEKLEGESKVMSNAHIDAKSKPKKPFLRKGQGLIRYKLPTYKHIPSTDTRMNSPLSPCNIQAIYSNKNNKSKKYITRKEILLRSLDDISVASETPQLNVKTIPSSEKKTLIDSGSISPIKQIACNINNQSNYRPDMNVSDMDSKAEREAEEVRIFELLEEKAENSSFCSTSSTVLAFLQQCSPFRRRKELNHAISENNVANMQQQGDGQTNDTGERKRMIQPTHIENSKPGMQQQFEQVYIKGATTNFYRDILNELQEEAEKYLTETNQISQDNEAHTDHSRIHDISIITLSDSDEEENTAIANDRNLACGKKADANHRVRFSKFNERRTIALTMNELISRDYFERQDNRFVDISDSDDEEKRPLNYKKFSSPAIGSENAVDVSLQQATTNDSSSKDDSPSEHMCSDNECEPIIEEIEQVSDDEEQSILSLSSSSSVLDTHQRLNTYEDKKYTGDGVKLMEKIAKIDLNNMKDVDLHSSGDEANTFSSELIKRRLLELEKEIDIFRKESSALILERRKLNEERTMLHKEHAKKEKTFEEHKRRYHNQLVEERRKLARVKAMMENRIRDAQEKAKQNKMERQKAQDLLEQLEKLRDEMDIKESRWNAAESRYKSEIRVVRAEISKLKQEIASLQNVKRTNVKNIKRGASRQQMLTKTINQINKDIVISSSKVSSTGPQSLSNCTSSNIIICDDDNNNEQKNKDENRSREFITKPFNVDCDLRQTDNATSEAKSKQVKIRSPKRNQEFLEQSVAKKKRHLYGNLLKDVILSDLTEEKTFYAGQYTNDSRQPITTQMETSNAKNDEVSEKSNDKSRFDSAYDLGHAIPCTNAKYCADESCELNQVADKENIRKRTSSPEKNLISFPSFPFVIRRNNNENSIKEIKHSDGCREYWYPNGNTKKFDPDKNYTKTIYYNGDIRESYNDGTEKYFFATTGTWQTTNPDGLQILIFTDGQKEKRMIDGTIEVTFPDGTRQITEPDGTKKFWALTGTIVQTFINGDKILFLPNGQKEIHTKEHTRREYSDGTVKLLYLDGTQETYYSNGRKRVKDKDGNLLMDSLHLLVEDRIV